ncbi:MAG: hypothetical protein IKS15_00725 [Opitutales bacterium]|nr:hypothetical protein [Opitutales bacterium]
MRKFKVFWKGECVGEFTLDEIREGAGRGVFGALHSVELEAGKTASVADILNPPAHGCVRGVAEENPPLSPKKDFDFILFGYTLAGLAFISPASLFGAFFYSIFLLRSGRGQLAWQIFILSLIIGVLGFCFHRFALAAI